MILILATLVVSNLVAAQVPLEMKRIKSSDLKKRHANYKSFPHNMYYVGPKKYVFPEEYKTQGYSLYEFQPKPGDVYLASFQKAATKWFCEVIWLLVNGLDFETANSIKVHEKVTWLEEAMALNMKVKKLPALSLPSPRLLYTYLPFSLIPEILASANKIIYVAMNPKDNILYSYDHVKYNKTFAFAGSLDSYWNFFENNLVYSSPYWCHLREGLGQEGNPRVLILYADEEPLVLIKKISRFLNKGYSTAKLKKLEAFMEIRRSIIKEGWKERFSKELNDKVNSWISKHIGSISFPNIPDLYA